MACLATVLAQPGMPRPRRQIVTPLTLCVAIVGSAAALAFGSAACGAESASPAVATSPQELSTDLTENDAALRTAIDAWRADGDPPSGPPPQEVLDRALFLQESIRVLARRPGLYTETIALLPARLARHVRDFTAAARKLRKLSHGSGTVEVRTGEPPPLADLVAFYREAKQRSRIAPHFLAAIHLVETKFGRVKNDSVAGAKGPMQFIPSTWKIYGHGGNIQDPHDAILAAARLLRANGAPSSYARALYAYNPSKLYVAAVSRYATAIARDPVAIHFLYCWGP